MDVAMGFVYSVLRLHPDQELLDRLGQLVAPDGLWVVL